MCKRSQPYTPNGYMTFVNLSKCHNKPKFTYFQADLPGSSPEIAFLLCDPYCKRGKKRKIYKASNKKKGILAYLLLF